MAQDSGLLNLQDQRNILFGNGLVYFGIPYVNLGQVKGDVEFSYHAQPYDVEGGSPLVLLRRFLLRESASVLAPLLEIEAASLALWFRNFYQGATTVVGTASAGGTIYQQSFGGNAYMPTSNFLFNHPTPEGGYCNIIGYIVYPPLELRLPFPEQKESIVNALFAFKADPTRLPGNQIGQVVIFVAPLVN